MKLVKSFFGLVIITAVLLIGFTSLYYNQKDALSNAEKGYREGTSLNIDHSLSPDTLSTFLLRNGYYTDRKDADYVSKVITESIKENGDLPNLGALNRKEFQLDAVDALKNGGETLKERVLASQEALCQTDTFLVDYEKNGKLSEQAPVSDGNATLKVQVYEKVQTSNPLRTLINKLTGHSTTPVEGVLVRLTEHRLVEAEGKGGEIENVAVEDVAGYAVTDATGVAEFKVEKGKYYSALPLRTGFNYGPPKGTKKGAISGATKWGFVQNPHRIAPFDRSAFRVMKNNGVLTVRTPAEYRSQMLKSIVIYLVAWWAAFLFIIYVDARLRRRSDHLVFLLLMTLTSLSLLTMFSIVNPLSDRLHGVTMAWGNVWGLVLMCAVSCVNHLKLFNSVSRVQGGVLEFDFILQFLRWCAMPFAKKRDRLTIKSGEKATPWRIVKFYLGLIAAILVLPLDYLAKGYFWLKNKFKLNFHIPSGTGYLLVAFMFVLLLRFFGTGPEGSDARVNLFFFQPSEISKYLVVVFMAAFFAANSRKIQAFSEQLTRKTFLLQIRTVAFIFVCIAALLLLYLVAISDMGPALVLMVTFIMIYSVSRRDFAQLAGGVLLLIVMLVLGQMIRPGALTHLVVAAVWFTVWIAGGYILRKKLYESALFMALVIVVFLVAGRMLQAVGMSEGQRLQNRTDMAWSGAWDNDVIGGDQVVQGMWSLATGGWDGQGLGEGNPNLVPECHTDMVFTSIGEVMGWGALVLIVVCLWVFLHRCLLLGRRAGHPFAFFLAIGIAVVTGVQFFVIVFGSIGLIPLTGVSVPFLSFGKSSLIINLAAFGIIMSLSRERATVNQSENIRTYDNTVVKAALTFMCLSLLLVGTLFNYQILNRDKYLISPAFITGSDGMKLVTYNPRIGLTLNALTSGNIYDRNGLLLASNEGSDVLEMLSNLKAAGLDENELKSLSCQNLKRYYPFGDDLFFIVGDLNTRLQETHGEYNPMGYMAEYRNMNDLKGKVMLMTDNSADVELTSAALRQSPFLPPSAESRTVSLVDYSPLLPMLKGGLKCEAIKKWNREREQRDLKLAVDAQLQVLMNREIAQYLEGKLNSKVFTEELRASVVVLDSKNGDMLCSSMFPLVDTKLLAAKEDAGVNIRLYRDKYGEPAYTNQDLGLTYQTYPGSTAKVMSAMSGLMKLGVSGAEASKFETKGFEQIDGAPDSRGTDPRSAIYNSSNTYFINFIWHNDTHEQLSKIYQTVGVRFDRLEDSNHKPHVVHPYFFNLKYLNEKKQAEYDDELADHFKRFRPSYEKYLGNRKRSKNGRSPMNRREWNLAWGQSLIQASPLNMARVASIVANNGSLAPTRFVLHRNNKDEELAKPIVVMKPAEATALRSYMNDESKKHSKLNSKYKGESYRMGSKTGTPQRYFNGSNKYDDAWYILFIYSAKKQCYLSIAVRLERSGIGKASPYAVQFVSDAVLPALEKAGYL